MIGQDKKLHFAISTGMADAQITDINTAVQTFLTTLSKNI